MDDITKKTLVKSLNGLILAALLITLISVILTREFKDSFQHELKDRLNSRLESSRVSLLNRFELEKEFTRAWSNDKEVIQQVRTLLALSKFVPMAPAKTGSPARLDGLEQQVNVKRIRNYYVSDVSRRVIASSFHAAMHKDLALMFPQAYFQKALDGSAVITVPLENQGDFIQQDNRHDRISIFALSPVYVDGAINAVLVIEYGHDAVLYPVSEHGRMGETGETYAFNSDAVLVSDSRFDDQLKQLGLITSDYAVLKLKLHDPGENLFKKTRRAVDHAAQPLTFMAFQALAGNNGSNLEGYRDYRGVDVVGAWLWDEEMNIGLATEMDREEAYKGFSRSQDLIVMLSALATLSVFIVTFIFIRSKLKLQSINQKLEQLVAEQTAKYKDQKKLAEQANLEKSKFLANMSHELRTPMHAIMSFAALALKRTEDEKSLRFLQNIRTSGIRLTSLLNDLLDLSKIEAGKMELDPVEQDLTTLIEQSISEVQGLLTDKCISIELATREYFNCVVDQKLMSQVVINLLSNAIKFSPENSQVRIAVSRRYKERDNRKIEYICLAVIDQGVGIPGNELTSVFDKFIQSSKTRSKAGGTGLGLPISKEIVELHNGRIWVESPPPGQSAGSAFYVEIPSNLKPHTLMQFTDIASVIEAHDAWVSAIDMAFVNPEHGGSKLSAMVAGNADLCGLGQWINQQERHDAGFRELQSVHASMHEIVEEYVAFANLGVNYEADKLKEKYLAKSKRINELLGQVDSA